MHHSIRAPGKHRLLSKPESLKVSTKQQFTAQTMHTEPAVGATALDLKLQHDIAEVVHLHGNL